MAKPTLMVCCYSFFRWTATVDCTVCYGSPYGLLQWTVRSDAGDYSM